MIYSIKGTLTHSDSSASFLVIETSAGVGYKINVSANTFYETTKNSIQDPNSEREVKLLTYLAVKENSVDLFGFIDESEMECFKLLLKVNGIGENSALSILSALTPKKLKAAIINEDSASITSAKNIGAKTAARIILDLKDKISTAVPDSVEDYSTDEGDKNPRTADKEKIRDIYDALTVLGYSRSEISSSIRGIDLSSPLEDIIKEALARLIS